MFGDKCGSFSDGVGQFVGIEKSPYIDQRLLAIGASKVHDQRSSKIKWDTSKIRVRHFTKIQRAFFAEEDSEKRGKGQK